MTEDQKPSLQEARLLDTDAAAMSPSEVWALSMEATQAAIDARKVQSILRQLGCTTGAGLAANAALDVATSFVGALAAMFVHNAATTPSRPCGNYIYKNGKYWSIR